MAVYPDLGVYDLTSPAAVSPTETRVTLSVAYDRMIDPVWYFGPLQRFAVEKGARYFIEGLLSNDAKPSAPPTCRSS